MVKIHPAGIFLSRKLLRYLLSFFCILLIVFLLPRMMPGDPVSNLVGEDIYLSQSTIDSLRAAFGLDTPLHEQFIRYCLQIMHGDLGYSYHMHGPVFEILISRAWWTLLYTIPSIIIGAWIGISLGARAGFQSGKWWSDVIASIALVISSTPPYLLSLLALVLFVYHLGLFPFKGFYDTYNLQSILYHLTLPTLVLISFYASRNILIMRGAVLTEKELLYPQFARSLGIPEREILFHHIRKNAIIPLIALIALDFGFLFSGALFIEIVFSLSGMGSLMYDAILARDYPILTGSLLIIAIFVIIANITADIMSLIIDPRIRRSS